MRKKQIEKIREEFESMDLSRYHILTYDELLKVNGGSGNDSGDDGESEESGGHEIENTVEAVANAEVGDTLTRDDGTQVTISQGDIDWAQEHCGSYGKGNSEEGEKEETTSKESDLQTKEDGENSDSSLENESNSANSNSTANNTAEEKSEQGTANSAKESERTAESGTAQSESNKTSSTESSQPVESGHSEKSGHSFFDGIVGWHGETSWMETVSFNGIGVFDRQSLDLRDYLEQSIEKGSFDAISGAAPKN